MNTKLNPSYVDVQNLFFTIKYLERAESIFPLVYDVVAIWLNNIIDIDNNVLFDDIYAWIDSETDNIIYQLNNRYNHNELTTIVNEQQIQTYIRSAIDIIYPDLLVVIRQVQPCILNGYTIDDARRVGNTTIIITATKRIDKDETVSTAIGTTRKYQVNTNSDAMWWAIPQYFLHNC